MSSLMEPMTRTVRIYSNLVMCKVRRLGIVENLDLCSFRYCCMPVLLVIILYMRVGPRPHPLASGDALALFIHSFLGLGTMCFDRYCIICNDNCGEVHALDSL